MQIRQTGKDQVDIQFDWSEINKNIRELLDCLKETMVKPVTMTPNFKGSPIRTLPHHDQSSRSPSPNRKSQNYRGQSPPPPTSQAQRCYRCSEIGHFARDCPHNSNPRTPSPTRKTQPGSPLN